MERALTERREYRWPLVVLHLDFKTNQPAHHRAVLSSTPMPCRRSLLLVLLLGACAPAKQEFPAPDAIIEQRSILRMNHSRYGPAVRAVVRDSAVWDALLDSMGNHEDRKRLVDFPTEMLLVAIGPSGGVSDSVVIHPVWHDRGSTRARVTTYQNCLPQPMETVPMDAVGIPRTTGTVKFENDTVRGHLCPVEHRDLFTVVLTAHDSDADSTIRAVIRDSTAWSAFIASARTEIPPRYVDFQTEMVIAMVGTAGGSMDSVRVEAIERTSDELRVVVVRYFNCFPPAISTMPVEAVSVRSFYGPIRFTEIQDYGPGCIEPGRRVIKR